MKQLKRLLTLVLVFCISTCLFACDSPNVEFDEFVSSLPTVLMDNDDYNIEYMFEHPENYGFEKTILNLPYASKAEYKDSDTKTETLLTELKKYNYKKLTDKQKVTYDTLLDFLERNQNISEFYYLDNSYLGSFIGFQAQLPLLLKEYTFEDKNDLDSYMHIVETSNDTFQKYAEVEEERQKHDCGLSKEILDKVIKQCETFSKDKDCFLIDDINQKIDKVDFLTKKEKKEYKKKNKEFITNHLLVAYKQLGQRLSNIDADKESLGLYYQDKGKEYYEYLLNTTIGCDMSVEEIRKYYIDKMDEILNQVQLLYLKNPDSIEKAIKMDNNSDATYCTFTSFTDTIDYLKEATSKDYPDLKELKYDVTKVPKSMKDNFSPAAYLVGKVDSSDGIEHIWVNGDFKQSLYETLAHEGYPGHMYQHAYMREQDLPIIHNIMDYNGYSEGWATYVEHDVWKYAQKGIDKDILHLLALNSLYTECVISLLDIEIHYDGIKYDDYIDEMKAFGINVDAISKEDLKEQYLLIVETPTNYLQYSLPGCLFKDYENQAKEELGENFNLKEFHDVLLKNGARSMSLVERDVQNYIKNNK